MNRIGDFEKDKILPGLVARPEPGQTPRPETPEWLKAATLAIRSKFATPSDGRGEWDRSDTVAYGRIFARLGERKTAQALALLRERFTWRPSVAEVSALADEISGREVVTGADAIARKVVNRPLAIAPHPDNPGRRAFQDRLKKMKKQLDEEAT